MTRWAGADTLLAQIKRDTDEPVAFVHWTLQINGEHLFLRALNGQSSLV